MKRIYLDNNATTQPHPLVIEAMMPYLTEKYGNASSIHSFGQEAKVAIDNARLSVAELLSASSEEIYFTAGGTEADNLAIQGVFFALKEKKGNHIITSKIEHHAVLNTCEYLEKKHGAVVTYLPVDKDGIVDLDELRKSIKSTTILISIMHANNETGVIQPIEEIGKIAKENNIIFHTDAVQTVGKIPIDVNKMNVDLLSLSGHKFYGPKGIGVLYQRRGVKLEPILHGGQHEKGRRPGTENVPGIVGLGKASEIAKNELIEEGKRLTELRDLLHKLICEKIPYTKLNGHPKLRTPGTLNISFDYIEAEAILLHLDMKGIAASSGSACASGSPEPSHVLLAMNIPVESARGAVRFSLGRTNTKEEIEYTADVLPPIIEKLRLMSPIAKY